MKEEKKLYNTKDIVNAIDEYLDDLELCGTRLSKMCGYGQAWYNDIRRRGKRGINTNIFNLEYVLNCMDKKLMVVIDCGGETKISPLKKIYATMESIRKTKNVLMKNVHVEGKLNNCKYERKIYNYKCHGLLSALNDSFMDGVAMAMGYTYYYYVQER